MNDVNQIYEWPIASLPSLNNDIVKLVKRMNKYARLPWPYSKRAEILKQELKAKLINVKSIHFDFDFSILYGNLYGESIWLTNTYILDYAPLYFGDHITIGPDVKLITSWHEQANFNVVKAKPIILEDNVWITMNAIILPGVTIGKNSIIGAGSIVTKSIPPNSLAAGNPAKVIKQINRDFPWWNELESNIRARDNHKKRIFIAKLLPKVVKEPLKRILFYFR